MLKFFGTSLFMTLTLSTLSYGADHHLLEDKSTHALGRQYNLIYDGENHNYSRKWIERNSKNFKLKSFKGVAEVLPKSVDWRSKCPPIFDQGQLGSCTANAINGAVGMILMKQKNYTTPMSRLFLYYNERLIEGTVNEDSGASLSDGIKSLMEKGVCHETLWPYSDDTKTFKKKPSDAAYKEALSYLDLDDAKIAYVKQDANTIKSVLAKGTPIVFGFDVYSSFETTTVARSGIVPMPNTSKEAYLGGHAVMLVGYDDNDKTFLVRNSWGTGWGMAGYCKFPQAYVLSQNLSGDFWSINKIGTKTQPTPIPQPAPKTSVADATKILLHLTSTIAEMQKVQSELTNFIQGLNAANKIQHT
jgi:C1A family cysteine protease